MSYKFRRQLELIWDEMECFCDHDRYWNRVQYFENKNHWFILMTTHDDTQEWKDFIWERGKWQGRNDDIHEYPDMLEDWWSGAYMSEDIAESKLIKVPIEIIKYWHDTDQNPDFRLTCTEIEYLDKPLRGRRPKGEQLIVIE